MKRTIAIILTVLFIVVLFLGCGGSGETNNTPATKVPEVTKAPEATAEPDSPYNFAAGKFKADGQQK